MAENTPKKGLMPSAEALRSPLGAASRWALCDAGTSPPRSPKGKPSVRNEAPSTRCVLGVSRGRSPYTNYAARS
eukprot:5299629-Alexandrium_andersonii.AAC.1